MCPYGYGCGCGWGKGVGVSVKVVVGVSVGVSVGESCIVHVRAVICIYTFVFCFKSQKRN